MGCLGIKLLTTYSLTNVRFSPIGLEETRTDMARLRSRTLPMWFEDRFLSKQRRSSATFAWHNICCDNRSTKVRRFLSVMSLIILAASSLAAQQDLVPAFQTGVERVALAVVVRDSNGRMVNDLTARDFELIDAGRPRTLVGVWSAPSPASVAILVDVSGSMATKLDRARETAEALIAGLKPGVDEAALYSFDTTLKELRPFSTRGDMTGSTAEIPQAYGATSLWDVIAKTAEQVSERQRRRALVVITDGVDSASRLQPAEVSAIERPGRARVCPRDRVWAGKRPRWPPAGPGSPGQPGKLDWWGLAGGS